MIGDIFRLVAVGSLLIGVVAIYITIRSNIRQVGAQIFLAYSDRIRVIRRATLDSGDPDAARTAMYLIFEFYELKRRGYVSGAIWSIWHADIEDLLRTETFSAQWTILRPRFQNHPHFRLWVDALQQQATNAP